ncbi:hypothetical protein CISIN_1g045819mg, partial [Citrus sinensis]
TSTTSLQLCISTTTLLSSKRLASNRVDSCFSLNSEIKEGSERKGHVYQASYLSHSNNGLSISSEYHNFQFTDQTVSTSLIVSMFHMLLLCWTPQKKKDEQ